MKTTWMILATALFTVLLIASSPLASADDGLSEALQKGLLEEEANHNLDAAIQAYQSAVNQFGEQRKIAATAVFRLGECYRKLGKTNEAAAHYERLRRDFPDQQQLVQLGQKYLMEWQRTGGAEGRPTPDEKLLDTNQVKLLEEEIKLAELQAADAKKSYESGRGALTDVIKAKRDLLALRRLLPENAGPAQRKALIEEEIKYVEQL